MNPTAHDRRISAFEEIHGPCTCELYGPCVLCAALSETDGMPTFNAAVTGLSSACIQDDGDDE
jgi:hypothetical protein